MSLLLAVGLVGNFVLFKGQMAIDSPRMTSASMMQLYAMRSLTLEFIWLLDRVLGERMEERQASGSLGSELSHCHFSWPKKLTKSVKIQEEVKQILFLGGRCCKVTLQMVWL